METRSSRTVDLGDVVMAIFDEAARYSTDPQEVARLATATVAHVLRRAFGSLLVEEPADQLGAAPIRRRPSRRVAHGRARGAARHNDYRR